MTRHAGRIGVLALWLLAASALSQPACSGGRLPERCAEIAAAEALLSRGEAPEATQAFERLAALEHSVDIEVGIVRSQLQAGEFRRALAFVSHTAGAHGNDASGSLLYAHLLQLSGQAQFAERVLAQVRARIGDAALRVQAVQPRPYAVGDELGPGSSLAASAVLVDGGRHAVVPSRAVDGATRIWVRDGMGRTVAARTTHRDTDVTVLALAKSLGAPGDAATIASGRAFPGTPASLVTYAATSGTTAAWPWLRFGFLGMPDATGSHTALNVDNMTGATAGGPVFDLGGRLLGISVDDENPRRSVALASAWRFAFDDVGQVTSTEAASPRLAPDALYERALRSTLQVLVER